MSTVVLKATTPTNCGCCSSCPGVLVEFPFPYDEGGDTSEADAEALMASNVADCLAYLAKDTARAPSSVSASKGVNSFVFGGDNSPTEEGIGAAQSWVFSIKLKAGSTVTINYSFTSGASSPFAFAELLACDGSGDPLFTAFDVGGSGVMTLGPLAADGEYILEISFSSFDEGGTDMTSSTTVSADNTMTENKVEIHWNDHGITGKVTC